MLEDNDPSGYKCAKGMTAKAACNLRTDDLPKRSPDLNVLDHCLWHEINKRMREQERTFPRSKKEAMAEYKEHLRKTVLRLPTSVVAKGGWRYEKKMSDHFQEQRPAAHRMKTLRDQISLIVRDFCRKGYIRISVALSACPKRHRL